MSAPEPRTGPVGIGIIGAGVISGTYLENLTSFPDVRVHAIGDLFPEAAAARAEAHGVPRHGGIDAVLEDDDVEVVVNLTVPAAHVEVSSAAIAAGKHVWSEKPIALDRAGGETLITQAAAAGVRLGCAPDTFLGAGVQASLAAIRRGDIGTPLSALTLMQSPGPESWHPNPAFLFQTGAGPLFDIGPYYFTLLVQAFGPVAAVAAIGSKSRASRVIGSGPKAGESFDVTVPTHVSAIAQFESGQSSQSILSFDSPLQRHGFVEITGTEATLEVPDPNNFDGDVRIRRTGSEEWELLASTKATSTRGTGVLEMARAIRAGRPHRVQGALAHHVVDVLASVDESIRSRSFVDVTSTVEAAEPLPADWDPTARTV
ncbi:Gfo/Idh/MocA family oxidoreductase [Paenibacillus sp. TRM 82003]|uniref:Gfo/Idh/MocA family protein n=1 Tax=Kineococcus sp. TRM81007 TaxID=2925831 RepID=UPI001F5785C7|nr:Gfo/Idh/MocA family oxidoreductase [Kineococcus sp. TRM81007]MCI2240487.1 Gfo/Idh/MocA family oxidoreductase [Kineococcus sp. TRM81007]MCI3925220.1 Gfo/Idh/MocA family oxidoreductase [Paenibacillus sp. TRM 82003]